MDRDGTELLCNKLAGACFVLQPALGLHPILSKLDMQALFCHSREWLWFPCVAPQPGNLISVHERPRA
eukprot:3925463-Amphidinium_carterae.2